MSAKIRRTPGRRSAYRVSRCQRAQGQARSAAKARHARRECAPSCRPGSGWRTGERRKRRAERCRAARGGRGGTAGRPGDAADDDPPPPPFPLDHQQRKHPSSAPPQPINALPGATWEQEGPSEDSLPDRRGAGGRGSCNPKRVANALEQPLRAARDPRCAALSKPRIQLTLRSDLMASTPSHRGRGEAAGGTPSSRSMSAPSRAPSARIAARDAGRGAAGAPTGDAPAAGAAAAPKDLDSSPPLLAVTPWVAPCAPDEDRVRVSSAHAPRSARDFSLAAPRLFRTPALDASLT